MDDGREKDIAGSSFIQHGRVMGFAIGSTGGKECGEPNMRDG
jgi:hypothetical protein